MVEKFFLALDYKTDDEAIETGLDTLGFLKSEFGEDFVRNRIGAKINEDLLTGTVDPRHRRYGDEYGCDVFADLKIGHGADTGERIVERVIRPPSVLPVSQITVMAGLGPTILKKYAKLLHDCGIEAVAFTAHTKIPAEEARKMYRGETMDDVIYNLGQVAVEGGFDAMVLEAERLKDPRIYGLPIKKLVTGIRIDTTDRGSQSRVTGLGELAEVKDNVNYVVVSSRYLGSDKRAQLRGYLAALL
ncbi:MAG: hypothetical protein HY513_03900 [Candidatus Aenigmarchaeota archaeon]|nr:hypothetical protein [Candidatus Aenigmarchaeota archaeon]